jgi:tight adherence protein B
VVLPLARQEHGRARWVTLITIGVLAVLALTGSYITPYSTPLGQMILVLLLGAYVATLVWMRRMAAGKPLSRFIGATARQQAQS